MASHGMRHTSYDCLRFQQQPQLAFVWKWGELLHHHASIVESKILEEGVSVERKSEHFVQHSIQYCYCLLLHWIFKGNVHITIYITTEIVFVQWLHSQKELITLTTYEMKYLRDWLLFTTSVALCCQSRTLKCCIDQTGKCFRTTRASF